MVERWVDEKTVVCAWNAPFEISWLIHFVPANMLRWVRWLDGELLWKHLENAPEYETAQNKRRRFGLKEAVATFLPQHAGYDDGVDFEGPLLPLMVYNAQDALFTRAITRHLYIQLEKHAQRLKAARIESHSLFDIGRANYEGFVVDPNGLEALDLTLKSEADAALSALAEHGATDKILASPKQLQKLMFDDWGLQPIKHGKTGPSTDQETLHELSALDDRVNNVRLFREAKNNRTKFVTNISKSLEYNNDDRSHPLARVFGTYSGRMTYSSNQGKNKDKRQIGWALHQMKRDKDFRGLVRAPEGHAIIEFDAAGQEFRWMAELSGDETMLFLCEPGQDPHSYMGASVWHVPYDEVIEGNAAGDEFLGGVRRVGKVANLSLQYRTSAKKLLSTARVKHGMAMTLPEAEKVHRTYRVTYPGVPRYWRRQIDLIMRQRYVETLAGRRVTVSMAMIRRAEWSVGSTSINFPIQGTGADQKYLALSVLRPIMQRHGAWFLFDLHDGIYFIVAEENKMAFIRDAWYALNNLPYEKAWGFTPRIPLPFDCKVGTSWGNMKELKYAEVYQAA